MIHKPFAEIIVADINALVENSEPETKTLEFKKDLPGATDAEKKEFLADVTALANSSGGDIIYGISEAVPDGSKKVCGVASALAPIADADADTEIRRLGGLIRDGVEPRMSFDIKQIPASESDTAAFFILLRVPRSFASPHMVKLKGTSRFYARSSNGKAQLDVHEIRAAFLATESQAERIRNFRQERLGRILAGETPVQLRSASALVLHVIPIPSFLNGERLQLNDSCALMNQFPPLSGASYNSRHNLDGFVTGSWPDDPSGLAKGALEYCQLFRHGAIEAVNTRYLCDGDRKALDGTYEEAVIQAVKGYLDSFAKIGLSPPFAVALAFFGAKGAVFALGRERRGVVLPAIDRDVVIVPETVMEEFPDDLAKELRPLFDDVANACGLKESPCYDSQGNRKKH